MLPPLSSAGSSPLFTLHLSCWITICSLLRKKNVELYTEHAPPPPHPSMQFYSVSVWILWFQQRITLMPLLLSHFGGCVYYSSTLPAEL